MYNLSKRIGFTHNNFKRALAVIFMITLTASVLTLPLPVVVNSAPVALTGEKKVLHVLNRLTFGARPGDVERVRAIGVDKFITQQLNPDKINDSIVVAKLSAYRSLSMSIAELYEKYPQPGKLINELKKQGKLPPELAATLDQTGKSSVDNNRREYREAIKKYMAENDMLPVANMTEALVASRVLRAVYSDRQLQEQMVDFWSNHFNVFMGKGADKWYLTSYDRDVIRPNALGNFKDLLLATAQSPAMLYYLDNFQSVAPNRARHRVERETRDKLFGGTERNPQNQMEASSLKKNPPKRARGINENYARELMELHTLGVDGGYTQKDVQEVARCFTGWTINKPLSINNEPDRREFLFNARLHDDGEKTVLSHKIPAGGGITDGLMVIDILSTHPSTAKLIATKLARKFVVDQPTPKLIDRVAAAFTKSSGDIRETLRAIFTSPEFNSSEAYRAKIKTPFELVISAIRALNGETNASPQLLQTVSRMGELLYGYQAPTGYPDMAEYWVSTGALLERLNFGLALAANKINGTSIDLVRFTNDARSDTAHSDNESKMLDRFISIILHNDVSAKTREALHSQLRQQQSAQLPASEARLRTREASDMATARMAGLILGSPEFQRQ